jgi:hypothetical protein
MINSIIDVLSLLFGILGLGYAIYNTAVTAKGIKISALIYIRQLINRMEEDKHAQPNDSPQWKSMHDTQQELESLFKSLKGLFRIKDKDAPL